MGVTLDPASLVKKNQGIRLGDLSKADAEWRIGHGWDDDPTLGDIDSDLWLVTLRGPEAIELVHYDPKNPRAEVVSDSGGLRYLGDARSGRVSKKGDDEKAILNLPRLRSIGADRVLVVTNIYSPDITYDGINNAYVRTFPLSALRIDPNDFEDPEKVDPTKVKAIKLTDVGVNARTVIFGWFEFVGPEDFDWVFTNQPSHAPDILTALRPFGVS